MWNLLWWPLPPVQAQVQLANVELPCADSSLSCLQTLQALAQENSKELMILDRAAALREERLWTHGLPTVSLGQSLPFDSAQGRTDSSSFRASLSLDLVTMLGGGRRALAELEIAQLQTQRAATSDRLALAIVEAVVALETAQANHRRLLSRLDTTTTLVAVVELDYAAGERDTSTMIPLWARRDELATQLDQTQGQVTLAELRLLSLLGVGE